MFRTGLHVSDIPLGPRHSRWIDGRLDLQLEADRWVHGGVIDDAVFVAIGKRLGLDFFGVDYTVLADGTVLLLDLDIAGSSLGAARRSNDLALPEPATRQIRDSLTMVLAARATVRQRSC